MDKLSFENHIASRYDEELEQIFSQLMAMGGKVEQQVQLAVKAILDSDSNIAERVIQGDKDVDRMEIRIDEDCVLVIARRQPTASDLRLVISVTRAVADLERIGDEAEKIAKHALELIEHGPLMSGYTVVSQLGVSVTAMLHNALDAFARFDADAAMRTIDEDKQVDQEYKAALSELDTLMASEPALLKQYLNLVWIVRSLERIGDHAKNLCEQIVFVAKGKDIRHQ
ncbi:phosphate signaling complex protein PhoU [Spongiibacter sp. KMU-158]|uniref:Phosphate-specific transport system accessory protein PhoU n=1 Tax=Spongiibacter pelagi TaxID=2760804 RepID=A0A927C3L2_9GAMM|nr:phosphate signaling complex protein PhoU [Spongiibacter pelagi]MBD2859146.1 phosphate signaling complex protein PhoU [Spongiibacter pelagi]